MPVHTRNGTPISRYRRHQNCGTDRGRWISEYVSTKAVRKKKAVRLKCSSITKAHAAVFPTCDVPQQRVLRAPRRSRRSPDTSRTARGMRHASRLFEAQATDVGAAGGAAVGRRDQGVGGQRHGADTGRLILRQPENPPNGGSRSGTVASAVDRRPPLRLGTNPAWSARAGGCARPGRCAARSR